MIVEYIRYKVPKDRADDFEADYQAASKQLDASRHCLSWEIARGAEEPGNYVVRIVWDSIEGHENGFRKSPEFRTFFGSVRPWFNQIEEMSHYRTVMTSS